MDVTVIQNLPIEILCDLFKHLPLQQVMLLRNECSLFQKAVSMFLKNLMVMLPKEAENALAKVESDFEYVDPARDAMRFEMLKSSLVLRFIATEIDLFFATVARYTNHEESWSYLCSHIAPVIEELYSIIKGQLNYDSRTIDFISYDRYKYYKTLYNFIDDFEDYIEDILSNLTNSSIPFEFKAIDVLMCCPTLNFQLTLEKKESESYFLYGYFKLSGYIGYGMQSVPDVFNTQLTTGMKTKKIIKSLREKVRARNFCVLNEIKLAVSRLEMISFHYFDEDNWESAIDEVQRYYNNFKDSPYQPIKKVIAKDTNGEISSINYSRIHSKDLEWTNMICVIDIPNVNNILPLALHRDLNIGMQTEYNSNLIASFQMVIQYLERLNSSPCETIINVNHIDDACHISFDNIISVPLDDL